MASRGRALRPVKSQYMVRDHTGAFSSASPRPEAEGRETETEGEAKALTAESSPIRQGSHLPAFYDTRNRNSTDAAFRQRQSQKDLHFTASSHHEAKHSGGVPTGEKLLQELYTEQCEQRTKAEEGLQAAQKERDQFEMKAMELAAQLTAQTQVNKELKKLLVASMGSDLQTQLENLAQDRAQLAQDLDATMAALLRERENVERINIQCDVWRSKFLGSRLQVDELISSRTHLDMLQQESCHALQQLLDERAEIRSHMMRTNRLLQYLSSALQRNQSINESSGGQSLSNVMTLGLVNEQLASTISSTLLGDVGGHQQGSKVTGGAKGFQFVEWTNAEMLSKDILLNKQPSVKLEQISQQAILQGPVPKVNMTHRYHPHTRYEHITINCCTRCKGDIQVV